MIKYITIDRIFDAVNKPGFKGNQIFNEIDIVGWTGEALGYMKVSKILEEALHYAEVSNFQIEIPIFLENIIQIARDVKFVPQAKDSTGLCPINIITDSETIVTPPVVNDGNCCEPLIPSCYDIPEGTSFPVVVNQEGRPLTEYELTYYKPFYNLKYDFLSWTQSTVYRGRFTPVRLSTHNFFESLVCKEKSVYSDTCQDEYKIVQGKIIRFSFESGGVVIAYNRTPLDPETGFPMIPEHESVIRAILEYIRYQYAKADFYEYREGSESRMQKSETDWHWYCKQATNALKMPSSVDEYENLLKQRSYLLPRNSYYGFFGNLNKQEILKR